ncbi:unnamed protein product [Prorocentrum cordatum]|uniref:Uncharacterized protein n=1 Tax=Prorocentrum cordatum TaxID=2364126 RepID=A0ABN9S509_9DINO|nr:unnamed protein product [Polarella glacialis]
MHARVAGCVPSPSARAPRPRHFGPCAPSVARDGRGAAAGRAGAATGLVPGLPFQRLNGKAVRARASADGSLTPKSERRCRQAASGARAAGEDQRLNSSGARLSPVEGHREEAEEEVRAWQEDES